MATSLSPVGARTAFVSLSGIRLTDALVVGTKWGTGPAGTAASLTFSFPDSRAQFDTTSGVPGNYSSPNSATPDFLLAYLPGFIPMSSASQTAVRSVVQAFASVARLTFTEVSPSSAGGGGELRFAFSNSGFEARTLATNWIPVDYAFAGDMWINAANVYPEGWAAGTAISSPKCNIHFSGWKLSVDGLL
jgi:hypothetical protein